ncbi:hypothetical protein LB506_004603 [Fusarium annulatum]|nr:hypothetical protein LB506_004603 [Fusarium annulatum]
MLRTYTGRFMGRGDPDRAAVERLEIDLTKVMDHYEKVLSGSEHLTGNQFSLVDIYHIPWFQFLSRLELQDEITKRPSLSAWWTRVSNRPAWKDLTASN